MERERLSACTYPLRERPVEYSFRVLAGMGFRKLDLWGRSPHFSPNPAECDPAELEALVARYGIRIANLGSYPGAQFAGESGAEVEAGLAEMRDTLDLAARFGCRSIRVRPGDSDDPALVDRVIGPFRESARYAEEKNVALGMENHSGSLAGDPELCRRLCQAVDSPFFGVLYEPCNLLQAGVDYREALEVFKPWVTHVHVKDGRRRNGRFERCHLGEGDIDLQWVYQTLESFGYTGDYALEYEITDREPLETGLRKWLEYASAVE